MGTFTPAISAEPVVRDALAALFDGTHAGMFNGRVVTETPANLDEVLPAVQVETTNTTEAVLTLEVAQIMVSTFDADRVTARGNAMQVHTAMTMLLPGTSVDGAFIAEVKVLQRPKHAPYGNTSVRRFMALYQVAVRSVPSV